MTPMRDPSHPPRRFWILFFLCVLAAFVVVAPGEVTARAPFQSELDQGSGTGFGTYDSPPYDPYLGAYGSPIETPFYPDTPFYSPPEPLAQPAAGQPQAYPTPGFPRGFATLAPPTFVPTRPPTRTPAPTPTATPIPPAARTATAVALAYLPPPTVVPPGVVPPVSQVQLAGGAALPPRAEIEPAPEPEPDRSTLRRLVDAGLMFADYLWLGYAVLAVGALAVVAAWLWSINRRKGAPPS